MMVRNKMDQKERNRKLKTITLKFDTTTVHAIRDEECSMGRRFFITHSGMAGDDKEFVLQQAKNACEGRFDISDLKVIWEEGDPEYFYRAHLERK